MSDRWRLWLRIAISRLHGSTVPVIVSAISIQLPETFRVRQLSRGNGDPPRAAGGNPDPLLGERRQRPATGDTSEPTTTVLQDQVMGRTALPQSPSRRLSWRAIFGSRKAVSAPDCALRGRASREGFFGICAVGDVGRVTGRLPG